MAPAITDWESTDVAQAMKSRIRVAETRAASISAVRNAMTSTPTATIFSIVMGAASRKLLSIAMRPSIEGNEYIQLYFELQPISLPICCVEYTMTGTWVRGDGQARDWARGLRYKAYMVEVGFEDVVEAHLVILPVFAARR